MEIIKVNRTEEGDLELKINWKSQSKGDEQILANQYFHPFDFMDNYRSKHPSEFDVTRLYLRKLLAIARTEGIVPAILHDIKVTFGSRNYKKIESKNLNQYHFELAKNGTANTGTKNDLFCSRAERYAYIMNGYST